MFKRNFAKRITIGHSFVLLMVLLGTGWFLTHPGIEQSSELVWGVVFAGAAIGLFLTLLLGISLNHSTFKEISQMTEIATQYMRGDFSHKISVEGDEMLEGFARAMNRMRKTLKGSLFEAEGEKTKATAILENMAEGVIAVDQNKKILITNPSAHAIFQMKSDATHGRDLLEVVKSSQIDELMDKALKRGETITIEVGLPFAGNKVLRVNAVGMVGNKNGLRGILVCRDITKMRQLENMQREFVANVSHELKTPLTSIKGFAETLLNGANKDPEKSEKFLRLIEEDSNRLSRLIDDILELSKIESKGALLKYEALDISEEIEKGLTLFSNLISEKKIIIQNKLRYVTLPKIRADQDQLYQVLLNLLENGIKFNREGGSLVIDADKQGDFLLISVHDTGTGVPKEDIPRIFERFYRVDKARSRALGGTGLGLSIVKHIIEEHGGAVSCTSEMGKGSTFTLSIPLWRS